MLPRRYFAESAAYVDVGYSYRTPGGHRQMIMAHVLCGAQFDYGYTLDKGLKRPPCIAGSAALYDSVKVCVGQCHIVTSF